MLSKFKIGHISDTEKGTGVTVILCEDGAVGGVSVRGAAPATRETDLLSDGKTVKTINAVVLSGGSAFGLEAACGVMDYLFEKGNGYNAGKFNVPIVCGASLYDLEYKEFAYPDKAMGYKAAAEAKENNFAVQGSVGAGTGATISKIAGMDSAVKAGIGIQTFTLNGIEIAVIAAVNALGDVMKDGVILAGAKTADGEFLDCQKVFSAGGFSLKHQNTTLCCVLTNAIITKEEANILASLAHDGLALSISPSHTMFDGDAVFVMSSCEKKAEFNLLTGMMPRLTAMAIQASVTDTKPIKTTVNPIMFSFFQRMWKRKNK